MEKNLTLFLVLLISQIALSSNYDIKFVKWVSQAQISEIKSILKGRVEFKTWLIVIDKAIYNRYHAKSR